MLAKNENMASPKGTILYVLTRFPVATETFILNELREMRRQGIKYHLLVFRLNRKMATEPPYNEVTAREIPRPCTSVVFSANSRVWPNRYRTAYSLLRTRACRRLHHFFQAVYLADWVKRHNVHHIHAHYAYHSTSAARVAASLAGIGYSFTAHANDIYRSCWQMREKIENAVFCATCTGYNARYLKEHYAQSCPDRVVKVYHGIDLEQFNCRPCKKTLPGQTPFRILSIGRLREKKGFPFLIEACAILRDRGLSIEATIVGEGPDREALEILIARKGLGNITRLTGSIPHSQVRKLLEDADVFVLPCIIASDKSRDGIPNVILEAMAMRLPVVSTTISAIPEAVEHGKTGLLMPPNNASALAEAISRLISAPDERIRMGDAGRKKVAKDFDLTSNTGALVSLFRTVMENRSSGHDLFQALSG
jgi:colanic acid/amylovoran biosynthesis glycosyltransferase